MKKLRHDNRPQFLWPAVSRPAYENYYGMVYLEKEQLCLWWRYTFLKTATMETVSRLWGALFDARNPERNFYTTKVFSHDEISVSADEIRLSEDSWFRYGQCCGNLDGRLVWDLDFEENSTSFRSVNSELLAMLLSNSRNVSPNNNLRVNGKIRIDGVEYTLDRQPGHQGHTWGQTMPQGWVWCHCNAFASSDSVFELVALDKGESEPVGAQYLSWQGQELFCNELRHLIGRHNLLFPYPKNKISWEDGVLNFSGQEGNFRFEGKVTADPGQFHLVRYTNTNDSYLYNLNDSVASIEIVIFEKRRKRWEQVAILESGGCQIEFVSIEDPPAGMMEQSLAFNRQWHP